MFLWIGIVVFVFIIAVPISVYNSMVKKRNIVEASYGNIDTELKRRFDLIPNLVKTAKKYMEHEHATLEGVIAARNNAVQMANLLRENPLNQDALAKFNAAETGLSQAMGQFHAVVEQYPDLKASGIMKDLMDDLSDTESRITYARQNYNDMVMEYNTSLEVFPELFFAEIFKFKRAETWVLHNEDEKKPVEVEF